MLALAATRLFDPFSGDQALFLVAAEKLHAGGVLYRDFWDIKQPGIFVFFLAGGLAFGFTQTGLHLADLVWQCAFALALVAGLSASFADRRWAAVAPLAVPGAYLTGSSAWHLLQVEELAGLPIFCSAWFATLAMDGGRRRRAFGMLSGLAAGIVLLFKLLFAPIVVALVLVVAASTVRASGRVAALALLRDWCLGACVPLAAFACYVACFGLFPVVYGTFVTLPLTLASSGTPAATSRLADSAMRFVLYFRGVIFLALVCALLERDERSRLWRWIAYAWILTGATVILVQRESWWQYQFALLLPPVGILATYGVAALARRVVTTGRAGFAWLALCGVAAYVGVPLPQFALDRSIAIVRERPFTSREALEEYRAASSEEYAVARADAALLDRTRGGNGRVYVFGNPLIYTLTDREQAIAMNGWALHLYTAEYWRRLDAQLVASDPQRVFLGEYARQLVALASPQTAALLAARYVPRTHTPDGEWLQARSSGSDRR